MTQIRSLGWRIILMLLAASPAAQAQPWSGIIDANRALDWASPARGARGGIPPRSTICATLSPGASVSQVNSAISNCPSGQTVFLNAGIDASEKRLPTRTVRRAAIHAAPLLDRFEHAAALALLNKWAGLAVGR